MTQSPAATTPWCGRVDETDETTRPMRESIHMRRTVLSALALACTAVLAGTVPAFADDTSPTPGTGTKAPSAVPAATTAPTRGESSTEEPTQAPTKAPGRGEVSAVPSGAPDTGVASTGSGSDSGLIGGGAAAVFAMGGAAVYVVRRRRATGA